MLTLLLALGTSAHLTVSVTVKAGAEVTIQPTGDVDVVGSGGSDPRYLVHTDTVTVDGQVYTVKTLHF